MSIVSAVEAQSRIIWSITARENKRQRRSTPFGIVGSLIEPLAIILMMSLVFSTIRLRVPGMGDWLVLFLLTGVVPIYTFKRGVMGADRATMSNRAVLLFRTVRPLDLMLGGLLNTTLTMVALFVLVTVIFKLLFRVVEPQNFMLSLVPVFGNACIAFGFASVNMLIKSWFPYWGTIWSIATAPLGIMSGLFYTAEIMPQRVRDILWYNPIFHSTDLCRHFYYPDYVSTFFDPYYYFGWVIGGLLVGLAIERYFRYRIRSSSGR